MSGRKTIKSSLAKILNENVNDHKSSVDFRKTGTKRKLQMDDDDELDTSSTGLPGSNELVSIFNTINSNISAVLNASKAKPVSNEFQKVLKEHKKATESFGRDIQAIVQKYLSDHSKVLQQREKKLEQILKESKADEQKLIDLHTQFLEKLQNDVLSNAVEIDEKYKRFFDQMKKHMEKDVEKEIKRILNESKYSK